MRTDVKQRAVQRIVGQFGRPRGLPGAMAGWMMSHRSSNRERNTWVVRLLDVQPTDRVLEIGFGPGLAIRESSRLTTDGHVYGIDHSAVMVRQATRRNRVAIEAGRVILVLGSFEAVPQLDEPLDKILAVNSMGFWPDLTRRLIELRQVLRLGGQIAIATQPRGPRATRPTSEEAAAEIQAALWDAGFSLLRVETLPMKTPVVCVIGVNESCRSERVQGRCEAGRVGVERQTRDGPNRP
jgi:SAM-dependent methyltransferase